MSVSLEVYNQMQILLTVTTIAGISAAFLIGIFWLVKNFLRTKASKIIDSAKTGHKHLVLAATPGHKLNLFKTSTFLPGVLETAQFKERIKKKRKVFYEPELTQIELSEGDLTNSTLSAEERKQSLALTQDCLNTMLNMNTQRLYLDEGVPVTLALEDKIITTGVKGIGALAYFEKLVKIRDLKPKIEALKQSTTFREVGDYLTNLLAQTTIIDIDVLRRYFDADWSQSDNESQQEYYYTIGYRDGKEKSDDKAKLFIYGGIAIGIVGLIGGCVIAFLGRGG